MPTEPLRIGKLFLAFETYERLPDSNVADVDELSLRALIENTNRPLGEAGRLPAVELRDEQGGVYEPVNLDEIWFTPRPPDTTEEATLRFRIPASSTGLELVLAPGEEEEASVLLEPSLEG